MEGKYLTHILESMIGEFMSAAHEEDIDAFKKAYPFYVWDLGFEEAIKRYSSNSRTKEESIKYLIDSMEQQKRRED